MVAERVAVDFTLVVTVPAKVDWFLEFTRQNPLAAGAPFFQEIAEEDIGGGVTHMPKVIRDFQENGGALLAAGTHRLTAQFVRAHDIARLQIRASVGTVTRATIEAVFGVGAVAPQ